MGMIAEKSTGFYFEEGMSSEELGSLCRQLPVGIIAYYPKENNRPFAVNNAFLEIIGFNCKEFYGFTGGNVAACIYAEDRGKVEALKKAVPGGGGKRELEYRLNSREGKPVWIRDIWKYVKTNDGREAVVSAIIDISSHVDREKLLLMEAQLDPLTGIYNRRKAIELIQDEIGLSDEGTLFICDIDNFKQVNDTLGHIEGDRVLTELAVLMKQLIADSAVISRLGGDEYMLYFGRSEGRELELMDTLKEKFTSTMKHSYPMLDISLSVGGVRAKGISDFKVLYRKADEALYRAKKVKNAINISDMAD